LSLPEKGGGGLQLGRKRWAIINEKKTAGAKTNIGGKNSRFKNRKNFLPHNPDDGKKDVEETMEKKLRGIERPCCRKHIIW